MPPSSNRLHRLRDRPGICRSPEYEAFLREAEQWRLSHLAAAREARARLQAWMQADPKARLRFEARFFFPRSAIYCRDGRPKRNDTENRLKALLDAVAAMLGCDDKIFWSGSFDKEPMLPGHSAPCVAVRLSLMAPAVDPARTGVVYADDHRNLTAPAAAA